MAGRQIYIYILSAELRGHAANKRVPPHSFAALLYFCSMHALLIFAWRPYMDAISLPARFLLNMQISCWEAEKRVSSTNFFELNEINMLQQWKTCILRQKIAAANVRCWKWFFEIEIENKSTNLCLLALEIREFELLEVLCIFIAKCIEQG